ncbi:MAG: SUMF1/EgtB/PvdO family nonheme iron enzyme, partial [Treponemataceae bacterium]|nr:SUMF1/EgtB/PvdO family nonheme iron enzyme [Treponemataceae bacterium]
MSKKIGVLFYKKYLLLIICFSVAVSLFSQSKDLGKELPQAPHLTPEQMAKYPLDAWFNAERPDYSEIDERVKNLAKNEETPEDVARIVCEGLKTNIEKARAIFDWICYNIAYDTSYKIYDADIAFKKRKGICSGYSDLFCKMANAVNLRAESVSGYARTSSGHAWNLVRLSDRDLLLDCCWGAGYVNGSKFTFEFKPEFFDAHPGAFALTHMADDKDKMLIYPPITDKSAFFKLPKHDTGKYWPYGNKDPVADYRERFCKNQPNLPVTFQSQSFQVYLDYEYISMGENITDGFFIQNKENSVGDLEKYLTKDELKPVKGHKYQDNSTSAATDLPLESIAKYCNALSSAYGFEECYTIPGDTKKGYNVECDYSKFGLRLPTKAEWLTACGTSYLNPSMSANIFAKAVWYNENSGGRIWITGHNYHSTENLLKDMLGNVSELCWDEDSQQYVFMGGNVFSTREEIQTLVAVPYDNYKKNKGANGFRLVLPTPKSPEMQYKIADLYTKNTFFVNDEDSYLEWLTLSAEKKYPKAISELSSYYYNLKTEEGFKKAYEYAMEASEFGDENALYLLAQMYEKGEYVAQNDEKALEFYEHSAELGNAASMYIISQFYEEGRGTEINEEKWFYWLEKAIKSGYGSDYDKNILAVCYRFGYSCDINYSAAFSIWKELADKNDMTAIQYCADCYAEGLGVQQSWWNAAKLYKKAADQGYIHSIVKYADCLFYGRGVFRDIGEAVNCYKGLIEMGVTGENDEYLKTYKSYLAVYETLCCYDDKCDSILYQNSRISTSEVTDTVSSLIDEVEKLQGLREMNPKLISNYLVDKIETKIILPMRKINSGETLSGNTLIIVNPYTGQKLDNLQNHIFSNKTFDGTKYYVNGEYYRYDEAFYDHYDNIILLKDQKDSFGTLNTAFANMKEALSECSEVDLMLFGTNFFSTADSYINDYVEIAQAAVDRGAKPRIIAFGNKTDVLQTSIDSIFSEKYVKKIHVFGTPLNMKGELACGFRSGNLFMVLITEKVNSK